MLENDLYFNKLKKDKLNSSIMSYMNSAHKITPNEFVKRYSEEELIKLFEECVTPYKGYKFNMVAENGKSWSADPVDNFFRDSLGRQKKMMLFNTVFDENEHKLIQKYSELKARSLS